MGDGAWTLALRWPRGRAAHGARDRGGRCARGRGHADALRFLVRQLEAPDPRSDGAHAPVPPRVARGGEAVPRERGAADDPRPTRPAAVVAAAHDRTGG